MTKLPGLLSVACLAAMVTMISAMESYATGREMTQFEALRIIAENIIRENAYDPKRLGTLLATKFSATDDFLPNHFRYRAKADGTQVLSTCDLRSPKTENTRNAILVCDTIGSDLKADSVRSAYGKNAQFRPARASAPPTALHYLSIDFDGARLSFGYDRSSEDIKKMVVNFSL